MFTVIGVPRHYVRLILDEIFGVKSFRNEIVWKRAALLGRKATATQFGRVTESIFYYSKTDSFIASKPTTERLIPVPKDGPPDGYRFDDREGKFIRTSPRGDYTDESILQARSRKPHLSDIHWQHPYQVLR